MVPEIVLGTTIGNITGRLLDNMINTVKENYHMRNNYAGDITKTRRPSGKAWANYDGITWDSKPNHDGWGPDDWWSAADWITWYYQLVAYHGVAEAKRIWVNAYDDSSYGAAEINFAVKNEEFKKFVQANGLAPLSSILSKLYRAETSVDKVLEPFETLYQGAGDVITGAGDALSGAGAAAGTLSKIMKWLPLLLVAAALVFAYFYFKPFAKAAKTVVS